MSEFLMVFLNATIVDKTVKSSLIKVIHQEYTVKLLTGKHAFDIFELMFEIIVDEATGASFIRLNQEISCAGIFNELDALSKSDNRDRNSRNFSEIINFDYQSDAETEVSDHIISVETDSENERTDYYRLSESDCNTWD